MSKTFERLWEAYPEPKRGEKAIAEKAWEGLDPSPTLRAAIIRGFEAWKGSVDWRNEEGRYIPSLASFLATRKWEAKPKGQAATPPPPKKCHKCQAIGASEISLSGGRPSCKPCLDAETAEIQAEEALPPLPPAQEMMAKAKENENWGTLTDAQ